MNTASELEDTLLAFVADTWNIGIDATTTRELWKKGGAIDV